MNANSETPDPPDDGLLDEEPRAPLRGMTKPPRGPAAEVDFAILQRASVKLASIRRRAQLRRAFVGVAAAAACLAIAFTFLRPSVPTTAPQTVAEQPDSAAIILREVRSLFHDQIQSIERDEAGALNLTLADAPISSTARAVALQIRRNGGLIEIITFTGQTINVLDQQVTVHADRNGKIQLEKSDGSRIENGDPAAANFIIKARFI